MKRSSVPFVIAMLLFWAPPQETQARLPDLKEESCERVLQYFSPQSSQTLDSAEIDYLNNLVKKDLPLLLGARLFAKSNDSKDSRRIEYRKENEDLVIELHFDEKISDGVSNRLVKAPNILFVVSKNAETYSYSNNAYTIPWSYRLDQEFQNNLLRFLLGHPIHPYVYSRTALLQRLQIGEPKILRKKVQVDLIKMAESLIDRAKKYERLMTELKSQPPQDYLDWAEMTGETQTDVSLFKWIIEEHLGFTGLFKKRRSAMAQRLQRSEDMIQDSEVMEELYSHRLLGVAPTGVGKSEVIKGVIRKLIQVQENSDKQVHLVLADSNLLVEQLYTELREDPELKDKVFIKWGDKEGSQKIDKLIQKFEKAKKSGKQVIFVTTTQSFKQRMKLMDGVRGKSGDVSLDKVEKLSQYLASVIYDEVHHAGASGISNYLDDLLKLEHNVFLYGTTATPMHSNAGIIDLFHGNAFWTYLDNVESFLDLGGQITRKVSDVIEQLYAAIDAGELTGFGEVDYRKTQFTLNNKERGSGQYEVETESKKDIVNETLNDIAQFRSGLITVNTINEANEFLELYSQAAHARGLDKNFAVLHSKMTTKEKEAVIKAMSVDRVDFIITVKMFDEGVNFPKMGLYIDLNRTVSPRQMLQRIGRVLRVAEGKRQAKVISYGENQSRNALIYKEIMDLYQRGEKGESVEQKRDRILRDLKQKFGVTFDAERSPKRDLKSYRELGRSFGRALEEIKSQNIEYKLHWGMVKAHPIYHELVKNNINRADRVGELRIFLSLLQKKILNEILKNGDLGSRRLLKVEIYRELGEKFGRALQEIRASNKEYKLHWGMVKSHPIYRELIKSRFNRINKIGELRIFLNSEQIQILNEILKNGDLGAKKQLKIDNYKVLGERLGKALQEIKSTNSEYKLHWGMLKAHAIYEELVVNRFNKANKINQLRVFLSLEQSQILTEILRNGDLGDKKFFRVDSYENLANQVSLALNEIDATVPDGGSYLWKLVLDHKVGKLLRKVGFGSVGDVKHYFEFLSSRAQIVMTKIVDAERELPKLFSSRTELLFVHEVVNQVLQINLRNLSGKKVGLFALFKNSEVAQRATRLGIHLDKPNSYANLIGIISREAQRVLLNLDNDIEFETEKRRDLRSAERKEQIKVAFLKSVSKVLHEMAEFKGRGIEQGLYDFFTHPKIAGTLRYREFDHKNIDELIGDLKTYGHRDTANFLSSLVNDVEKRRVDSPLLETQRAHQMEFADVLSDLAHRLMSIKLRSIHLHDQAREVFKLFNNSKLGVVLIARGYSFDNLPSLANILFQYEYTEEAEFLRTIDREQKEISQLPQIEETSKAIRVGRFDALKFRDFCDELSKWLEDSKGKSESGDQLQWKHLNQLDIVKMFSEEVRKSVANWLGVLTFSYIDKGRMQRFYGYLSDPAKVILEHVAYNSNDVVVAQREYRGKLNLIEERLNFLYKSSQKTLTFESLLKDKEIGRALSSLEKSLDDLEEDLSPESLQIIQNSMENSRALEEERAVEEQRKNDELERQLIADEKALQQEIAAKDALEEAADVILDEMDKGQIKSIQDCLSHEKVAVLLNKAGIRRQNFELVLELLPRKYRNQLQ